MIIEMMPYRELIRNQYPAAGIQNQIYAVRIGRGAALHAILEFTAGSSYWQLKDLGFQFKTVNIGRSSYLHGVRPREKMSLVGIPFRTAKQVTLEIQHQIDRLKFPLSHQSEPSALDLPQNVEVMNDWKPVA